MTLFGTINRPPLMNLFGGGGGGGGSVPKPPPFKAVDIDKTADLATTYANIGYDMTDKDFAARFPGIVGQQAANRKSAVDQLTGPLDPAVQADFVRSSAANALSSFGGSGGIGLGEEGSAARGSTAANVNNLITQKEDADRAYAAQQYADNPPRDFGITGEDALNLLIGNTLGKNQYKYALYSGQVQQANASAAAGAQQTQAGIQTAISVAGLAVAI